MTALVAVALIGLLVSPLPGAETAQQAARLWQPRGLAPIATGRVVSYYAGVMRTVARNRGMTLFEWVAGYRVDGYASSRFCHRVDTVADPTLRTRPYLVQASLNGGPVRVFQIVDCSRPGADLQEHIRSGLILEVDRASGLRDKVDALNNQVRIYRIWRP